MSSVAAILPCRGRVEQTIANAGRLLATAGTNDWRLYAVGGQEEQAVLTQLAKIGAHTFVADTPCLTYWQALDYVTSRTNEPLICTLANDLLPGMHWLARAIVAYRETFGDAPGMIGFNGDSHELDHSCHFLISRALIAEYGGWPLHYQHNFGDTELCQRAIADGRYAKAPWALLYHNHPYWAAPDDQVYAEGRATVDRDQAIYERRRARQWQ